MIEYLMWLSFTVCWCEAAPQEARWLPSIALAKYNYDVAYADVGLFLAGQDSPTYHEAVRIRFLWKCTWEAAHYRNQRYQLLYGPRYTHFEVGGVDWCWRLETAEEAEEGWLSAIDVDTYRLPIPFSLRYYGPGTFRNR